jgi:hypothetical protein
MSNLVAAATPSLHEHSSSPSIIKYKTLQVYTPPSNEAELRELHRRHQIWEYEVAFGCSLLLPSNQN